MSDFIFCLASCLFVIFSYFAGVRFGKIIGFKNGWKACCNEPDYFKDLQKRHLDNDKMSDHDTRCGGTKAEWTELYESACGGEDDA